MHSLVLCLPTLSPPPPIPHTPCLSLRAQGRQRVASSPMLLSRAVHCATQNANDCVVTVDWCLLLVCCPCCTASSYHDRKKILETVYAIRRHDNLCTQKQPKTNDMTGFRVQVWLHLRACCLTLLTSTYHLIALVLRAASTLNPEYRMLRHIFVLSCSDRVLVVRLG